MVSLGFLVAGGLLGGERGQEVGNASVNGGVPNPGKRLLLLLRSLIRML